MKKGKISIFLSFLIIFTGVMFFNVGKVDAAGCADCIYSGHTNTRVCANSNECQQKDKRIMYYKVALQVQKLNNKFTSSSMILCSHSATPPSMDSKYTEKCTMKLNNSSGEVLKSRFYGNNKWSCPDKVYAKITGVVGVTLYFNNPDEGSRPFDNEILKFDLVKNDTLQDGCKSQSEKDLTSKISKEGQETPTEGDIDGILQWAKEYSSNTAKSKDKNANSDEYLDCSAISNETKEYIGDILFIVSLIGVFLFIFLTIFEFIKALVSSDDNKIAKILKTLVVRIICVIVLLLLPVIVTTIINVINVADEKGIIKISDPLCGVEKR